MGSARPAPAGSTQLSAAPKRAMVLAAGLGTRMRPLTETLPKPLIEVAGKALIDHALDSLERAGVEEAVVNLHHFGDMIRAHLAPRRRPAIAFSDESETLLDTGGGVAKALERLGPDPFLAINGDILWLDGAGDTLARLGERWNDAEMDALLLLQPTVSAVGYDGQGDYRMDAEGRVRRRGEQAITPFLFAGVQVLHPRLFDGAPEGPFSLNLLWDRAERAGRLYGLRHEGSWAHVGTPEAIAEAAAMLVGS